MDQIFSNKVNFMFLFIFIARYIFSIVGMEIICSKIYFSLLYELFKLEVPKIA